MADTPTWQIGAAVVLAGHSALSATLESRCAEDMTHVGDMEFAAALAPLAGCPGCGSIRLLPVHDLDSVNLLCRDCHRCWHVELGWVSQVDPLGCVECPHRPECLRFAGDSGPPRR